MSLIILFIALIPFYLIGAIPVGIIVSKLSGVDITTQGSGNVGATNVTRVLGLKRGAAVFIGDFLKGYLALALAQLVTTPLGTPTSEISALFAPLPLTFPALVSCAVVMGHCFSIPGFLRGGKGVATAFGVLCFAAPNGAVLAIALFALVLYTIKMVSAASITAVLLAPILAAFTGAHSSFTIALVFIAVLIVARHRENIARIAEGREHRIGARQ